MKENNDDTWSEAKNSRRSELIDRLLQRKLTVDESQELARLTNQLRERVDTEQLMPVEGAIQLHQRLIDWDAERRTSE